MNPIKLTFSFLIVATTLFGWGPESANSQVVIQVPSFRVFRINTVVSVPDGGTMSLGGVKSHREQSVTRGSGLPGPLFNNRGIAREANAANASVSAKLIIMSEYEEAVMAEARRRRRAAMVNDPNGPPEVQAKADFISRNIGRNRKKR